MTFADEGGPPKAPRPRKPARSSWRCRSARCRRSRRSPSARTASCSPPAATAGSTVWDLTDGEAGEGADERPRRGQRPEVQPRRQAARRRPAASRRPAATCGSSRRPTGSCAASLGGHVDIVVSASRSARTARSSPRPASTRRSAVGRGDAARRCTRSPGTRTSCTRSPSAPTGDWYATASKDRTVRVDRRRDRAGPADLQRHGPGGAGGGRPAGRAAGGHVRVRAAAVLVGRGDRRAGRGGRPGTTSPSTSWPSARRQARRLGRGRPDGAAVEPAERPVGAVDARSARWCTRWPSTPDGKRWRRQLRRAGAAVGRGDGRPLVTLWRPARRRRVAGADAGGLRRGDRRLGGGRPLAGRGQGAAGARLLVAGCCASRRWWQGAAGEKVPEPAFVNGKMAGERRTDRHTTRIRTKSSASQRRRCPSRIGGGGHRRTSSAAMPGSPAVQTRWPSAEACGAEIQPARRTSINVGPGQRTCRVGTKCWPRPDGTRRGGRQMAKLAPSTPWRRGGLIAGARSTYAARQPGEGGTLPRRVRRRAVNEDCRRARGRARRRTAGTVSFVASRRTLHRRTTAASRR